MSPFPTSGETRTARPVSHLELAVLAPTPSLLIQPKTTFDFRRILHAEALAEHARRSLACVLVDEAQFLSRDQVLGLARLADEANIPVVTYGLRTDFAANLFPGSAALLGIADALVELKGVCECGRKATMNLRVDGAGRAVLEGAQTEVGGNDRYVALCRKHFMAARAEAASVA